MNTSTKRSLDPICGSFLGIVVTPALLLMVIGISTAVPVSNIFISLFSTVVIPLFVGQIVRHFFEKEINSLKFPFSNFSSAVLLLIIYNSFCETFSRDVVIDVPSFLFLLLIVFASQLLFLYVSFQVGKSSIWGLTRQDVIALILCSTHKSLTLGMPMINIMFSGRTEASLISIPLLIYHPMQIFLGSLLVPWMKKWLQGDLHA